jgi:hypothetical protein
MSDVVFFGGAIGIQCMLPNREFERKLIII